MLRSVYENPSNQIECIVYTGDGGDLDEFWTCFDGDDADDDGNTSGW